MDARHVAHTALIAVTCWLVLVMLLLPLWSFEGYSLLKHTTSHLGAQGSPHARVMNATFFAAGVATQLAGWRKLRPHPLPHLLLSVFAMSLVLTGLYQHAPMVEGVEANAFEDQRHSIFATTTGFGFVIFAVSMAFVSRLGRDRAIAIGVAVAATLLSLAMAAWPELMGLFQRIMFAMAFGWLIIVTRDADSLV